MFTIEQIKTAHSKVKSGADYPGYVQELIALGVNSYQTYVTDGHTVFMGSDNFTAQMPAKYAILEIAGDSDEIAFKTALKLHQQGKTDYPTFCADCARTGVEKWVADLIKMTCTYHNKMGTEILVETIPTVEIPAQGNA